jgi:hypothetical protein
MVFVCCQWTGTSSSEAREIFWCNKCPIDIVKPFINQDAVVVTA